MSSRTFLTISTASKSLLIGCYLLRRMDLQRLVTKLQIHGIEDPNFFQPHYVLKVPTHQDVYVRYSRQGDVQQVIPEFRRKGSVTDVDLGEIHCLFRELEKNWLQLQDLLKF